jgi:hypothetical protein
MNLLSAQNTPNTSAPSLLYVNLLHPKRKKSYFLGIFLSTAFNRKNETDFSGPLLRYQQLIGAQSVRLRKVNIPQFNISLNLSKSEKYTLI